MDSMAGLVCHPRDAAHAIAKHALTSSFRDVHNGFRRCFGGGAGEWTLGIGGLHAARCRSCSVDRQRR